MSTLTTELKVLVSANCNDSETLTVNHLGWMQHRCCLERIYNWANQQVYYINKGENKQRAKTKHVKIGGGVR